MKEKWRCGCEAYAFGTTRRCRHIAWKDGYCKQHHPEWQAVHAEKRQKKNDEVYRTLVVGDVNTYTERLLKACHDAQDKVKELQEEIELISNHGWIGKIRQERLREILLKEIRGAHRTCVDGKAFDISDRSHCLLLARVIWDKQKVVLDGDLSTELPTRHAERIRLSEEAAKAETKETPAADTTTPEPVAEPVVADPVNVK